VRQWAERGLELLQGATATWSEPSRFVLESTFHLVSHSLADQAENFERRAMRPDHVSVPHLAFPAAALGYAQRGDETKARHIASRRFSPPPQSWTVMQALSYWAQVAYLVGEPDPSWLYGQLLPHAGQLALVGIGADTGGAVDCLLAGLALRMGRPAEALRHAQAGLSLETRAEARYWADRTAALIDAARS
jgi:hypothetical protein